MSRRVGSRRVTAPAPQGAAGAVPESPGLSCLPPVPSSSQSTRHPPAAKNLRWTAMAVVSVLSDTQEQHVDDVVERVARAAKTDGGGDLTPAVRNARRRVHDALKVMISVGCVNRTGENLRWIGVEHLQKTPSLPLNVSVRTPCRGSTHKVGQRQRIFFPLPAEICKLRIRIAQKRALVATLKRHAEAFRAVVGRNQPPSRAQTSRRRGRDSRRLQFPFVLVKVAKPEVIFTPDRALLRLDAKNAFRLYTETDVVCFLAERWSPYFRKRRARKARLAKSHGHGDGISGQSDHDDESLHFDTTRSLRTSRTRAQVCTTSDRKKMSMSASAENVDNKPLPRNFVLATESKRVPNNGGCYPNSHGPQNDCRMRKDDAPKRQRTKQCTFTSDVKDAIVREESTVGPKYFKFDPSICSRGASPIKFEWDDIADCYDSNGEDFGEDEINSYQAIDSDCAPGLMSSHVYDLPLPGDEDNSDEVDACLEAMLGVL